MRTAMPFLAVLALAATLGGCNRHGDGRPWVEHGWVRLSAVPGHPAAAYVTLHAGAAPVRLVSVDAAAAGSSELHETLDRSGPEGGPSVMSMDRVDGIDVAAGQAVTLSPGDYHAMLFGVSPAIKPGDTVKLQVRLAKGSPLPIDAKAVAAGDPAPY